MRVNDYLPESERLPVFVKDCLKAIERSPSTRPAAFVMAYIGRCLLAQCVQNCRFNCGDDERAVGTGGAEKEAFTVNYGRRKTWPSCWGRLPDECDRRRRQKEITQRQESTR